MQKQTPATKFKMTFNNRNKAEQDAEGEEEGFGPLTPTAWKLSSGFEVVIIDSDANIKELDHLIGSEYIGICTKPFPSNTNKKPTLLQLCNGHNKAFLIDFKALANSIRIDIVL